MNRVVFLIEQTAVGIYIFVGIGLFIFWRRWVHARQSLRSTYFELERDIARYKTANAITAMILLIEAALVVTGMQRVVAPAVREHLDEQGVSVEIAPEDLPFETPIPPTLSGQGLNLDTSNVTIGPQQFDVVFITPTPTPTPVGTIVPNAPLPVGCNAANAMLQVPANGMRVFQPMAVIGSAFVDDFAYYKIELSGPGTLNSFVVLDQQGNPVEGVGPLSQFNPAPWAADPGPYQLQLMVFDIDNVLRASCQVTIYITEPVPTPTPLGE